MNRLSELIVFPDGATYRRTGECDGCRRPGLTPGQCCTYIMLPLARRLADNEQAWAELHQGVTIIETTEGHSVRMEVRCSALAADGRCRLFAEGSRPQFCRDYPEWPGALKGLPQPAGCIYEFETL